MAPINPNAISTTMLSMQLLIDTKSQRVLYAEAGKDVVDFLLSLLAMPVATVAKLLSKDYSMAGSVGNLYGSVEKLDETYVLSASARKALLSPPTGGCAAGGKLLQHPEAAQQQLPSTQFYRCLYLDSSSSNCYNYVTRSRRSPCQHCDGRMAAAVEIVDDSTTGSVVDEAAATAAFASVVDVATTAAFAVAGSDDGFVQGIVTYTVMDDLKVAPILSTISGITLLHTFGITDISMLQERTVQLGYHERLEILRVSLQSKTVLTDVFLEKKRKA